jgi:hypothetical protein
MRKRYWSLLLASSLALGGLSVACGDDPSASGPSPLDGGGTETSINPPPPNPEGGPNPDGSVPDAGCNFATYVIGLINTQTTPSAKPDTTLGAGCVDNKNQVEFKPLFP